MHKVSVQAMVASTQAGRAAVDLAAAAEPELVQPASSRPKPVKAEASAES
jgi:hypothetical protein